jgi:WD40 repeat protein
MRFDQRTKMSVRVLTVLGGAVLVAGVLAGVLALGRGQVSGKPAEETRLAPVKVVAARVFRFGEWTELVGSTQPLPDRTAHVSAPVAARIVRILGEGKGLPLVEGGPVQANQILVQLDDSVPRAYREQLAALRADLERQRKQGQSVASALGLVEAGLAALDAQIAQFSIRAPFAGVLGPIQVTPGQAIRAGTTVADVVRLDEVDVLCCVPPRTLGRLAVGQKARLSGMPPPYQDTPPVGSKYADAAAANGDVLPHQVEQEPPHGKVAWIAPQADPATGNYAVKVRFANRDGRLRLNCVERVQVLTEPEKDRLTIPEDALLEDQDPPVVMAAQNLKVQKTATGDTRVATAVALRPVLGVHDRELRRVEILQLRGAQTGDLASIRDVRFIIEGAGGLHDNDPLRVDGDPSPSDDALKLEESHLNAIHARITIPGETAWALTFTPDGKTLVSGGQDGTVKLWDIATGKNTAFMPRRTKSIKVLACRPDAKVLAAGIKDGTIALWDVAQRKQLLTIAAHYQNRNLEGLAFSPDGKTLASVGHDEPVIKLWDPLSGKLIDRLSGHKDYIGWVQYSPDGKLLVSGAEDATIRLWDTGTAKQLQVLEGSPSAVAALALHPGGKVLTSWSKIPGKGENPSGKSVVSTWEVSSGRNLSTVEGKSGQKTPFLGVFSPDTRILAWAAGEQVITLWDAASASMIGTLQGHTGKVLSLAFSPDGRHLASGSEDNTIRIWELPYRAPAP